MRCGRSEPTGTGAIFASLLCARAKGEATASCQDIKDTRWLRSFFFDENLRCVTWRKLSEIAQVSSKLMSWAGAHSTF